MQCSDTLGGERGRILAGNCGRLGRSLYAAGLRDLGWSLNLNIRAPKSHYNLMQSLEPN